MVIAGIIAAASLGTLFPLYASYCASAVRSVRMFRLSERVGILLGTPDGEVAAEDFDRVLELLRLCPEDDEDRSSLRAVTLYFHGLRVAGEAVRNFAPRLAVWIERERASCAHFAAIALDRRICSSRSLLAEQESGGSSRAEAYDLHAF
jgi:hypothetical protein